MCHPSLQPQQQPGGPASGCSKLPFLVLSAPTYQAPELLQHKKTFTTIILKALRRFSARGGETCGYPNRQSLTQKGSTLGLKESEDTQPYQNSTASVDPDTTIARCGKSGPSCTVLSEGAPAHCAKTPATAEDWGQPRAASQLPQHSQAVPRTYRASALVREGIAHSAFRPCN